MMQVLSGPLAGTRKSRTLAKKKRHSKVPSGSVSSRAVESRSAETVTVAWMMSVMMTLFCGGAAALVWLAVQDPESHPNAVLFGRLLHFSAIVTALTSLVLAGVALKIRRLPPPKSVTIVAVILAVLPILAAFF